ncbi:MAG: dihydrofolate reductase [Anaerolinea sp.]|nr:dihydrofolate reductase [Anaerolinea sp.]
MRKLVVTEFMTLDGVVENPMWSMRYWNDEISTFKGEESNASDALLLGRVTYEGFAAAWPNSKDAGADYFNGVRKYVVSNTLTRADWNNSVIINGNVVDEIARLKQTEGKDIIVHGSTVLVQTLLKHNLVDHVRLLVYPVVLGTGQRLIHEGTEATLNLVDSKTFKGGVLGLIYEPARK